MSRELKFRAWDGKNMYDRVLPFTWDFVLNAMAHTCVKSNGRGVLGSGGDEATFEIQGYRYTEIMQFTGLKDKNGKEIYEGDILRTGTDKNMVVGWSEKFASFVLNRDGWAFQHWFGEACDPGYCEVIGNIHQNPELLTKT